MSTFQKHCTHRWLFSLTAAAVATLGAASAGAQEAPFVKAYDAIGYLLPANDGFGTRDLQALDMDADGDADFLAVGTSGLAWFENKNGDGASWSDPKVISQDTLFEVTVADIDGDGDIDLVAKTDYLGGFGWFENVDGSATAWRTVEVDAEADDGFAAGDFDGDGDMDLVASHPVGSDGGLHWYENEDGAGTSWRKRSIASEGWYGDVRATTGDVNGDGLADIVAISRFYDHIKVYLNDGNGAYWTEHDVDTAHPSPQNVQIADIDFDGNLDIVASGGSWVVYFYRNADGSGTAWGKNEINNSDELKGARPFAIADIDGDCDLDIVASSTRLYTGTLPWSYGIRWWSNEGDGKSWVSREIHPENTQPYDGDINGVAAADFNGDGSIDVAASDNNRGHIGWWENTAAPVETDCPDPPPPSPGDPDGSGGEDGSSGAGAGSGSGSGAGGNGAAGEDGSDEGSCAFGAGRSSTPLALVMLGLGAAIMRRRRQ